MTMRLHTNPLSQHGRRVAMAIHELGLTADVRVVDFNKGEHKAPEYLVHNPNGKVPVLEDNGFWLWESNAIMAYLADKKQDKNLYPTEAQARATVNQWLFWESAHFGAACARLTSERVVKPMMKQEPDQTLVTDGETNFKRFAAVLNNQLEGKTWVTGNNLTIADFAIGSMFTYQGPAGLDLTTFRHVQTWVDRLTARDSWKKTQPQF